MNRRTCACSQAFEEEKQNKESKQAASGMVCIVFNKTREGSQATVESGLSEIGVQVEILLRTLHLLLPWQRTCA